MTAEAKHCPDCRNEFVASVEQCSDCGAPLKQGELPRGGSPEPEHEDAGYDVPEHGIPPEPVEPPDTLVATLPGEDAERVARAMALERITSLLDCDGAQELRGPNEPPKPAIARRKPVAIYVSHSRAEEAREIIDSLTDTDPIGDQWREGDSAAESIEDAEPAPDEVQSPVAAADLEAPQAEGSGRYLLILAALGAVLALFIALL